MSLRITTRPSPARRPTAAGRLADALHALGEGRREVAFAPVDGVWQAPERDPEPRRDRRPSARPIERLYTAAGELRALLRPALGHHLDVRA